MRRIFPTGSTVQLSTGFASALVKVFLSMAKLPILYVEDDKNDVLFMELAFAHAALPFPLKVVWNGQEALDYLMGKGRFANREEFPLPCLVLLDLNLPLKSGFEVLSWIRQQPSFASLPVVIFSSSVQTHDVEKAQQLHASQYVEKLSNPANLASLLNELKDRWLPSR